MDGPTAIATLAETAAQSGIDLASIDPPDNRNEDRKFLAQHARRKQLIAAERSIEKTLKSYRRLEDEANREIDTVRFRSGFIRCDPARAQRPSDTAYSLEKDGKTRPVMTRLVTRKQHSLQVLLSLIYTAHLEHPPGNSFVNKHRNMPRSGQHTSWLDLTGLGEPQGSRTGSAHVRAQRRKLTTALTNLADQGLVNLIGRKNTAGRFDRFGLYSEDGTPVEYKVPGERQVRNKDALEVPADFFRNGWHLVLSDLEIVTMLAIMDRTAELRHADRKNDDRDIGVDLKESIRWSTYGLSTEAYNTIHNLDLFGCIEIIDPIPNRRQLMYRARRSEVDLSVSGTTPENTTGGQTEVESVRSALEAIRLIYPPRRNEYPFARPALDTAKTHLYDNSNGYIGDGKVEVTNI